MSEFNAAVQGVLKAAKTGEIDLNEVRSFEDVQLAAKFSPYFREAIKGFDRETAMRVVALVKSRGRRHYRPGVGLWLTDAEFNR